MFLSRLFQINSQRGDTIVEVLISTAVISLVLTGAYAISNRSVSTNRDTQEHSQAQQVVQRQIEELRAMAETVTPLPVFQDQGCVVPGGTSLTFSPNTSGACNFSADGSMGGCTVEPCYQVSISKSINAIYTVTASWNNVLGGRSKVAMGYGI